MLTDLTDLCGSPEPMQANVAMKFDSWLPPSHSKSSLTFQRPFLRFVDVVYVTLTDEKENSCVG
jgi:hypothetical protein